MYSETLQIVENEKSLKFFHPVVIITGIAITTYLVSFYFNLLEFIVSFTRRHEGWQLDEFITVFMVLVFVLAFYSVRQWRRLALVNHNINQQNRDLQDAFSRIRQLEGIIPICSSCKKIRDDKGYWHQVEAYLHDHSQARFSHGICPDCMARLYPDFREE